MAIRVHSVDKQVDLDARVAETQHLSSQLFKSLDEAVAFFRNGSLGLSPRGETLDGVRLECPRWEAAPAQVLSMSSNLYDDESVFPEGTCEIDCALVMRNLAARWVPEAVTFDRAAA